MGKMVMIAALFAAALGLAACDNTVRGAGQDIRDTSEAVADAVE